MMASSAFKLNNDKNSRKVAAISADFPVVTKPNQDEIDENRSPFVLNPGDLWRVNLVRNPELAAKKVYSFGSPSADDFWCKQPHDPFPRARPGLAHH